MTSSAGTMDQTSSRRESLRDSTKFLRAVTPWLPSNSRALEPESIRSKLPRASSVRCSRKLPHVANQQSSHKVTSHTHTHKSMVSKEETCEWDRETERFCNSLTFSRPGWAGLSTDQGKRRRKSDNTSNAAYREWEGNHVWSGLPQTWPKPS